MAFLTNLSKSVTGALRQAQQSTQLSIYNENVITDNLSDCVYLPGFLLVISDHNLKYCQSTGTCYRPALIKAMNF